VVGGRVVSLERARAARVAAPIAFLLAVTIAVLVVRAGLRDDGVTRPTPAGVTSSPAASASVVVRSGDTLEGIALRVGTSVATLQRLNPGLRPEALRVGQSVRVRPG
jgi:LysM repeat protein